MPEFRTIARDLAQAAGGLKQNCFSSLASGLIRSAILVRRTTRWFTPIAGAAIIAFPALAGEATREEFLKALTAAVPVEQPFQAIDKLARDTPHLSRDRSITAAPGEIEIADDGWTIATIGTPGSLLNTAIEVFRTDLEIGMGVSFSVRQLDAADTELPLAKSIVLMKKTRVNRCADDLAGPKDYHIRIAVTTVTVCAQDEVGLKHGLYNLLARFKLREAPLLPATLDVTRNSYHEYRMTLTGIGWNQFPDAYLETISKYGLDAIYVSEYANPDGSAPPAFYGGMRVQDPALLRDLIARARRHGIDVFAPLLFEIRGDGTDETRLKELVRSNVAAVPGLRGYVILTEGFMYGSLPKWSDDIDKTRAWIDIWSRNVALAAKELKAAQPDVLVLAWDYNIDFRPEAAELKAAIIAGYDENVTPLITWENGKRIEFGGQKGWVRDYSISEAGPSEAARAQIATARKRGMKVFSKADGWSSWQFGTFPYIPVPEQWNARAKALQELRIDGTLESWTQGFVPSFISELRYWSSWSNAPDFDNLLDQMARREFGEKGGPLARQAWTAFSEAIRKVPSTGPSMSTNSAVAAPFFLDKPEPRAAAFTRSHRPFGLRSSNLLIHPDWPYAPALFWLLPDFSNNKRVDLHETNPFNPDIFIRQLVAAADAFEAGLKSYRAAALATAGSKRVEALKHVARVEQMHAMLTSAARLLEFEGLRFSLAKPVDPKSYVDGLERMRKIANEELTNANMALMISEQDSSLGYNWAFDYIYGPHVLRQKISQLNRVLRVEIPRRIRHAQTPLSAPVIEHAPPASSMQTRARFSVRPREAESLECRLDKGAFAACPNPVTIENLAGGSHAFEIRAVAIDGRRSAPAWFEWTVEAPPAKLQ